jgi:hypothetical protein
MSVEKSMMDAAEVLRLWNECGGASNEKDALRFARAIERATRIYMGPTGEQLYMMVTGRFKSGSFPWAMVSESGKAAWTSAAADLLLYPDTILARYS